MIGDLLPVSIRSERRRKRMGMIKNAAIFITSFAVFMLFLHYIRFPIVSGTSMNPTYDNGDILAVFYTHDVADGDVAVVWSDTLNEYIVKRVMGTAGDRIEIKDGRLYRNGICLYEPYIKEQSWAALMDGINITVPDGYIYVLGDNRNNSTDSRKLGLIDTESVFGRVLLDIK
jgi:signal peptidase I